MCEEDSVKCAYEAFLIVRIKSVENSQRIRKINDLFYFSTQSFNLFI